MFSNRFLCFWYVSFFILTLCSIGGCDSNHISPQYAQRHFVSTADSVRIVELSMSKMAWFVPEYIPSRGIVYHVGTIKLESVNEHGFDCTYIREGGATVPCHVNFSEVRNIQAQTKEPREAGCDTVTLTLRNKQSTVVFGGQLFLKEYHPDDLLSALLTLCPNAE